MSAAIHVFDLVVRYRARGGRTLQAVDSLSFEVAEGEVVGFLGPNGAGKSSTIKALMGFLEPESGECRVLGEPGGSAAAKRNVGYLPEVAVYYPFLTPLETLTLYGKLQGLDGKALRIQAEELFGRLGLEESVRRQNRTLSKGMLQRVGIAQALLGRPRALILDEVTSGLDPLGRKELRALLREKRDQGCTLFFSSHELGEVETICDRILVLNAGRLIDERPVADLMEGLRRYSLSFEGPADVSDLAAGRKLQAVGIGEGGGCRAEFETKAALLQAIERICAAGGKVLDVVSREGSLEDYFVDAVGRAA